MAVREYDLFIQTVKGEIPDPIGKDEETTATPRQIGWWKQFQFRRALNHARHGQATGVELHLLKTHGIIYRFQTPPSKHR
jgi:hypothetical protein